MFFRWNDNSCGYYVKNALFSSLKVGLILISNHNFENQGSNICEGHKYHRPYLH